MSSLPACAPLYHQSGAVATLTLNRPAFHNRLHQEDLDVLLAHIATVQAQPEVRVLVLQAQVHPQRPVFCSGFHLGEFENEATPQGQVSFERVPDALAQLKVVTIAALNGSVYGGATDMALACDFRLGVVGMQLRMPAAALGLHFYPSGLIRYASRWGLAEAKKAFLTAHTWSDQELLQTGFLDELLAPERLPQRVQELALNIAGLAPLAVQGMKQSLNEWADGVASLSQLREREAQVNRSADFVEGRLAFAERRTPQFRGL
jgi:enoyl-CoA hydratase/carnithine racemase